ncbi:MAG: B-box zinc finger protein [Acidobacteriota bacterium]|nr:B-box zinc finger protein [Acidobacteriota bacterium]
MKCPIHPEKETVAYCGQCGRPLCAECQRVVRGVSYCENCLAARMQSSAIPHYSASDGGPQPGLALFLGFIPGVGAIYNGQILKAIIEVLIFGCLIGLADSTEGPFATIFGLLAAAFYCYMVIDSYQTARRKQLGQPTDEWLGVGEIRMGAPGGAVVLIILGAIFLLDNLGLHVFSDIGKFWPVLLIIFGVFLLEKKMKRSGRRNAPIPGPANQPEDPGAGNASAGGQGSGAKEL